MKKFLLISAIVIVSLVVLGVAGFAYAQTQTPPAPGFGPGMMNGRGAGMMGGYRSNGQGGNYGPGMMSGRGMMGNGSFGPMHDYMIQALADKLGLPLEELKSRMQAGETPYEIAKSQGLSDEQIQTLFNDAHDAALKAAVAAGALTQEQADWMDQHMEQMWGNGGPGFGPCHGGGAGTGGSSNLQPSQPTQPSGPTY